MSLVGNIGEMGLGEILQIVSLSRRSGVLSLESRGRKGRIIFQHGQVTTATSTSFRQSLGEMLVHKGMIGVAILNSALRIQAAEGCRQLLGTILVERFGVSADAIETVVSEQIEEVIYSLLPWTDGTFSFEMHEVTEIAASNMGQVQFVLKQGLNPQYLAMEGARILDEKRHRGDTYEEREVAAAEPASASISASVTPEVSAPAEPTSPSLRAETVELIEVTGWLVMAVGGAALAYGIVGLLNYYTRDWQTVLSEGVLVPVSKLDIFLRFGFIPWTITVGSLYLSWAGYQFWKQRENSFVRLIKGLWTGIAVVVTHEAVELGEWLKLGSSTPTISFYMAGITGSLFWAVVLSAPFAGLLFYLNSDRISREFRWHLSVIHSEPSRGPSERRSRAWWKR